MSIMKAQMNVSTGFNKQENDNLNLVVKETLAVSNNKSCKNFTTVDLWKIERQRRSSYGRRYSL